MLSRIVFFIVLVSLALLVWTQFTKPTKTLDDMSAERVFRFEYTVQNSSNELIKDVVLSVQAPVEDGFNQKVNSINASLPYTVQKDALNNQKLFFEIDSLAPYSTKNIEIDVSVTLGLSGAQEASRLDDRASYLVGSSYVELTDKKLIDFSSQFSKSKDFVSDIAGWLEGNMEKIVYTASDLGALHALEKEEGDCTEFMYLGIAAARLNNIPARAVGGFVYADSTRVQSVHYHNWFEVFENGKWKIVDAYFGQDTMNPQEYLAMQIYSDEKSQSNIGNYRFSISNPKVNVIAR